MSEIKPKSLIEEKDGKVSARKLDNINKKSSFQKENFLKKGSFPAKKIIRSKEITTSIENVVQYSTENKTEELADIYSETNQVSHRYLAYRDIPSLIETYVNGKRALDYGSGTGISTAFLHNLGFDVVGVDINNLMLEKARKCHPKINFLELKNLNSPELFNLVFSSFVLFDMKSKVEIISYFEKVKPFIIKNGIFIAITGSEDLYCMHRKWIAYESFFEENKNLKSGSITRLRLKNPQIEFYDYFWRQEDYLDCIKKVNFKILEIHKPLGSETDPYLWEDEKSFAPFTVYILQKV